MIAGFTIITYVAPSTLIYSVHAIICNLNQARAGHRPVHAWFLKAISVRTSVCVPVPKAINN